MPEVAGDGEAARAGGVDVGARAEGAGGEVGRAALEEEAAALEAAGGGDLGAEEAGLGGLELLLGLRGKGRMRRGEVGVLGFGVLGSEGERGGERGRDVEDGEAVVAGVLHLPDALLEGGRELHRAAAGGEGSF